MARVPCARAAAGALAALSLALAALAPGAARAEDDPGDAPYFEGLEAVDVQAPPCRIERPSDGWLFLNLEVLAQRARAAGQDARGYEALKARLWRGSARANIYVRAQPDVVARREPATSAELGRATLARMQEAWPGARVVQQGAVRVGRREGFVFELHATPPGAKQPVALVLATVFRPEDNQIFTLSLEVHPDRLEAVRKDFAKLLKKARI